MFILRHHQPPARFAGWAFICLTIVFIVIAQTNAAAGLSGLGAILVLASLITEANKDRIWQNYKRQYKYRKTDVLPKSWTAPNQLYYNLNVYLLWPIIFVLGLTSIVAGWLLG